ncbi:predicted protein [Nematostella vectensis]|uniref:Uncharacterized protein n=1 Tax=Nematostella vectensis TaxID=45351 RepID=A7SMH2_NEMVE|nr:uncharacterized protein LOC5506517 [Nematostella vectensis]EDO35105.1 predicted protein [Nematostella vectensis]|eukprot:XP_001627205.1 predicted protein [Nematostella vectensis]
MATAELVIPSPCYRVIGATGGGLEASKHMSMKMIETKKEGLQKIVTNLEKRLDPLRKQRDDLKLMLNYVNDWIRVLHETDRGHSGVPVLRSARDGCDMMITPHLNESSSEFNQAVFRLESAEIPCFAHVQQLLKQLRKEIRVVFQKESTYNGKFVEDAREMMGRIIGIISAILGFYY